MKFNFSLPGGKATKEPSRVEWLFDPSIDVTKNLTEAELREALNELSRTSAHLSLILMGTVVKLKKGLLEPNEKQTVSFSSTEAALMRTHGLRAIEILSKLEDNPRLRVLVRTL